MSDWENKCHLKSLLMNATNEPSESVVLLEILLTFILFCYEQNMSCPSTNANNNNNCWYIHTGMMDLGLS